MNTRRAGVWGLRAYNKERQDCIHFTYLDQVFGYFSHFNRIASSCQIGCFNKIIFFFLFIWTSTTTTNTLPTCKKKIEKERKKEKANAIHHHDLLQPIRPSKLLRSVVYLRYSCCCCCCCSTNISFFPHCFIPSFFCSFLFRMLQPFITLIIFTACHHKIPKNLAPLSIY